MYSSLVKLVVNNAQPAREERGAEYENQRRRALTSSLGVVPNIGSE